MARDTADDREASRLAALYRYSILDTAPDPSFDSLVRLVADVCGVPVACVTFIDAERQWFKAACGIEGREIPRDNAFCSHAILTPGEVMVVEDATQDPRFANNPLVTAPHGIRFYAGAPIVSREGHALGALCIVDHEPRQLDDAGRARLSQLADGVLCLLDLKLSALQLARLVTHDRLTGLPNRTTLDGRLDEAVAGALGGRPCGLLVLDIDGLKEVNESHGHAMGDMLLREAADRLKRVARTGDLVARVGGGEFAIVMAEPVGAEAAAALAGRAVAAMHIPIAHADQELVPSASVGIALCPLDATEPGSLMRSAQQALFRAKRGGRGRFAHVGHHGNGAGEATSVEPSLADALRNALRDDEFSLIWQPYFSTATGEVLGCEALARWNRSDGRPISPDVFVPVIEASGLSGRFDAWVLDNGCRAALDWPDSVSVAINLSAQWFNDGDAVAFVETVLRRYQLSPRRLCLEITERTLVTHAENAWAQMTALRDLGVNIALDDFGVGFSSLTILRRFPFDKVKLDRAFTKDLVVDRRADAVARAVLQLGRALDMGVCAEGVETAEQLRFLCSEECELVQGYLLGRPNAAPQFVPSPAGLAALHGSLRLAS